MKRSNFVKLSLAAAIQSVLISFVFAADTATVAPAPEQVVPVPVDQNKNSANTAAQSNTQSLEGIVVTGAATAGGVKKLDASFSVVAANQEQIKQANPTSVADLMKISPGIWPESSGGQTGANIEIGGFPTAGGTQFMTVLINGAPTFPGTNAGFADSTSMLRLDDTVERVEIVQGGPGAVFTTGQPGATANFILRQGTSQPSGDIGLTYGDEGLWRVDGFYGFPLADGWYASIGGFWRESDGVRSPQFKADDGGQLTMTLTHDMDNGSFTLWGRILNDKNQWLTPTPLIQTGSQFSLYPGFNALTDTYYSKAMQNFTVYNPAGGVENANLANGRGNQLYFFGGSYDGEWGGWSISDKALVSTGTNQLNGLFSSSNPRSLSYFLYGCAMPQAAGLCNGGTALDTNNLGPGGQGLPTSLNISANYTTSGVVPLDQFMMSQNMMYLHQDQQSISNEFRLSRELFEGNSFTVGAYLAHFSLNGAQSVSSMLMNNVPNATPITLSYVQNGQTYHLTDPQGFYKYGGGFLQAQTGNIEAIYLSDSWKLWDRLILDASGRLEHQHQWGSTCNFSASPSSSIYDLYAIGGNAPLFCNGTFTTSTTDKTHPTLTAGVNYEIADNMSAYIRANTGSVFSGPNLTSATPSSGNNTVNQKNSDIAQMEKIRNLEYGFKYQSEYVYLDLSAYHRQFTGLQYQQTTSAGVPFGPILSFGSDTKGLDFRTILTPIEDFKIDLVAGYMKGHYTHYDGCIPYTNISGLPECSPIDGKPLQRQPNFRYAITPSYKFVTDWGDITPYMTYSRVGQRYEDQLGLAPLGPYYTLNVGVVAHYDKNWDFRLSGTNMTNQIGLTEGNARIVGASEGIGGVILARSIEGREINMQIKYHF